MEIDQLLETACPLIGSLGAAFYFAEATTARGQELGLDLYRFYFIGRGGVLGDVEAPVIASAFGYFKPSLVTKMWDSARETVDPRDAARAYMECCHQFARTKFSDIDGLEGFCQAGQAVVAAADPAGLALYAGIASEPLPEDVVARAMHLVVVLREMRGSAHLIALRAEGLEPKVAHYLRRPEMFSLFGYGDDDLPTPTDSDRAKLAAADELTDRLVAPAYSVLDTAGQADLVSGLERMKMAVGA